MLLTSPIAITSLASLSPLGHDLESIWEAYLQPETAIIEKEFENATALIAPLSEDSKILIDSLRQSDIKYKQLDDSVLFAIATSRQAIEKAGWSRGSQFGINIGSSRGATQILEQHHTEFLQTGKTKTLTSPTTTLGNISSWVSHDLQSKGPEISHSITCSTSLHALLNGVAWLQSGMESKFLIGGSEASLTEFTLAQMRAMKIYAQQNETFPCRAFDLNKTANTMVMGEGAAIICLERGISDKALAYVEGIGYATEMLVHNSSMSTEADCFQQSMKMALENLPVHSVDVVVTHSPGTKLGDSSEDKAIKRIFGSQLPLLTNNKWKIGHTLGASGILSVEMALLMMQHNHFIAVPFLPIQKQTKKIERILVNAVGFGGNAVSVLLRIA